MRNNESIRAFPIVQVTFITFLVRRNILCSITLRNFTRRWQKVGVTLELKWNGGKAGRKENGGWRGGKLRRNPPDIVFSRNALHQTLVPSLSLSLSPARPFSRCLSPSLFHPRTRRALFVWILYLWHEWKRG